MRPKKYIVAATCALLATTASSAYAADYKVTLYNGFLERAVQDAVTSTIIAAEPNLYWGHVSGTRVDITRKNATTISVDLDLAFQVSGPDPEVDVDIDLGFSCFHGQPNLNVSVPYVDVDLNWDWTVDVVTGGLTWVLGHVTNKIIDKKIASANKLKQEILATLDSELDDQIGFEFCPAFNVTSAGDLEIIFGPGNECTAGQTHHTACNSNQEGPGWNDSCINGYWERTGGYCEPKAPPGGQTP